MSRVHKNICCNIRSVSDVIKGRKFCLKRHCQDVTQSGKTELYLFCVPVKMSLTDTSVHDMSEYENNNKYLSLVKQN